jgi:uncharacterized SAM-binding protein YcdF (DUF218 family)
LGEQLIVSDSPKKSDAIVVFSGDGKVSYQNLSYQQRALDSAKFYKKGYADKIFLSSGREQTISDSESIRLFLINKGIPEHSIHILGEYPNSTYQNIIMVRESLKNSNVESILFLTSPYHTLRSSLLWRENAKNISITTLDLRSLSSNAPQWGVGFDKMRVIVYEYSAIIYNWILGRV